MRKTPRGKKGSAPAWSIVAVTLRPDGQAEVEQRNGKIITVGSRGLQVYAHRADAEQGIPLDPYCHDESSAEDYPTTGWDVHYGPLDGDFSQILYFYNGFSLVVGSYDVAVHRAARIFDEVIIRAKPRRVRSGEEEYS